MISRCFPQPVPVRVAGSTLFVSQLRLRDLATLESWAMCATTNPITGLVTDSPTFKAELQAAYDASMSWPPELGTNEVDGLVFNTLAGRALVLTLACRETNMTADLAAEIVNATTSEEWQAVRSVAVADDPSPFTLLSAYVDRLAGVEPFDVMRMGKPTTWEQAIISACGDDPTRLEAIGNLTIGQWILFQSGGVAHDRTDPIPADPNLKTEVQDKRAAWWANDMKGGQDGPE